MSRTEDGGIPTQRARRSWSGLLACLLLLTIALVRPGSAYAASAEWVITGQVPAATQPTGGAFMTDPSAIALDDNDGYIVALGSTIGVVAMRYDASGNAIRLAYSSAFRSSAAGPASAGGIARAADNSLFVTDRTLNRVARVNPDGSLDYFFGSAGAGNGEFNGPGGIAIAPDASLLIVDSGNDRVVRHSAAGAHLATYGSAGSADGQFDNPQGIVVEADGSFWVTDTSNNRIQHFDSAGNHLMSVGGFGAADGQFAMPSGIALDRDGDLLIVDSGNHRVQELATDGTHIRSFGDAGPGPAALADPVGVIGRSDGSILVADALGAQLREFQADGTPVGARHAAPADPSQLTSAVAVSAIPGTSGGFYAIRRMKDYLPLVAVKCDVATGCQSHGTLSVDYTALLGIVGGPNGTSWLSDVGAYKIIQLDQSGANISMFGAQGAGPGEFYFPSSIYRSSNSDLWVLDPAVGRIQRLTTSGAVVTTTPLPTSGYFSGGMIVVENEQSVIISVLGASGMTMHKISVDGTVQWSMPVSADSQYLGLGDLGDGTFITLGEDLVQRSVATGAVIRSTPLPESKYPIVATSTAKLGDGRVVIPDAANGRILIAELQSRAVTVAPTQTIPTTISTAPGAPASLSFASANASGPVTYTATFGSSSVPISADGTIQVANIPEGRATLRVLALDTGTGQTAVYDIEIVVDRTAPVIGRTPRFFTGKSARLAITDALTTPTSRSATVKLSRVGANTVSVQTADSAGNSARRTVIINRRPSLVEGGRNGGVELWRPDGNNRFTPDQDAIRAVFGGSLAKPRRERSFSPALIREVQFRLKQLGYTSAVIRSSGQLDVETRRGLRRLQKANGLTRSSTPNAATRRALDRLIEQL